MLAEKAALFLQITVEHVHGQEIATAGHEVVNIECQRVRVVYSAIFCMS